MPDGLTKTTGSLFNAHRTSGNPERKIILMNTGRIVNIDYQKSGKKIFRVSALTILNAGSTCQMIYG